MPLVAGVVFRRTGKVYYFDPAGHDLRTGDYVIVKTQKGMDFGEMVTPLMEIDQGELSSPLRKIERKAADSDRRQIEKNKEREEEAYGICEDRIAKHKLPMRLVDVKYAFDGHEVTFYFTADSRVDFRELVKELASVLKTRIELRQIGVRDEARLMGGLGPCGRPMCCTLFSGDFEPVSIRMAKDQDLPLNPWKISGACGRLMCCIKYESETYKDFKERAPKRGTVVETRFGSGKVVDYSVPKEAAIVEVGEGFRHEVPLSELKEKAGKRKEKKSVE